MDELAKRFADLAAQYGPKVADAAMQAARVEAYSCMAAGALCLLFGAGFFYAAKILWHKWEKERWDEITLLPFGILVLIGITVFTIGVWSFVDPWTWTTLQHPELWIAKKAFKL